MAMPTASWVCPVLPPSLVTLHTKRDALLVRQTIENPRMSFPQQGNAVPRALQSQDLVGKPSKAQQIDIGREDCLPRLDQLIVKFLHGRPLVHQTRHLREQLNTSYIQ